MARKQHRRWRLRSRELLGSDQAFLVSLVQAILGAEMGECLQARKHQRTAGRLGCRSGHFERGLGGPSSLASDAAALRLTREQPMGRLSSPAAWSAVRPRLHPPDGRQLFGLRRQEQDRSEPPVGPPRWVAWCQIAQQVLGWPRQPQDVHHLRDPRPAHPEPTGEVRAAVHHTVVEEALELEGEVDGAPPCEAGFGANPSLRGNYGLWKPEQEPADGVLPVVLLGEPITDN